MEASSKKPLLPSSQAHSVRESLFSQHLRTQEEEWAFLMNTYRDFAAEWRKVSEDSPSLYVDLEKTGKDGVFHHYTHFLDALEAAKFKAPGREREKGSSKGSVAERAHKHKDERVRMTMKTRYLVPLLCSFLMACGVAWGAH